MKKCLTYISLLLLIFFISCGKDPETVPEGTVRLFINVNHHGYPIANARVFRKNNVTSFPGEDSTLYDTRYVTDANGNLTLTDIGNGTKDIWFYVLGNDPTWDSTIITPVMGYKGVHLVTGIGESKDFETEILVSE